MVGKRSVLCVSDKMFVHACGCSEEILMMHRRIRMKNA